VDLIVRGICNLVPNIKGVSENIRVRSILGRYLEHSRIYYFANASGAHPLIFAGSSDWMPRNFYRRIEAVYPVDDAKLREQLTQILEKQIADTKSARILRPTGAYQPTSRSKKAGLFCAQEYFAEEAEKLRKQQEKERSESEDLEPA